MLKYNIKIDKQKNTDGYINIPIGNLFYPNTEHYEEFYNEKYDEVKLINAPIDYEKIKITPIITGVTSDYINSINFNLHFYLDNNWPSNVTKLSEIGFIEDDVKNKKQSLIKTFLRLSFYDSNELKSQNLLGYSIIYIDSNTIYSKYISNGFDFSTLTCNFKIDNPKMNTDVKSFEGFYIYLFKDDVGKNETKTIYMKIEYNSALSGRTSLFLKNRSLSNSGYEITGLKNNIFIPISIKYDSTTNKYVYWFNDYNDKDTIIEIYQAKVI